MIQFFELYLPMKYFFNWIYIFCTIVIILLKIGFLFIDIRLNKIFHQYFLLFILDPFLEKTSNLTSLFST